MKETLKLNQVRIAGTIKSNEISKIVVLGKKYKTAILKSQRQSLTYDNIPLLIPENMETYEDSIYVTGEIFSLHDSEKHLKTYILVDQIKPTFEKNVNEVLFLGRLASEPVYNVSHLSHRHVTTLFLEYTRKDGSIGFVRCISWNKNAILATRIQLGEEVSFIGRIQSREYSKRISEFEYQRISTNEISITRFI